MLPEAPLRLITCIVLVSFIIQHAQAGNFESALTEGRSLGSEAGRIYAPDVLDSTLQTKGVGTSQEVLPRGNSPTAGESHHTGYYTQPGNMGNAASGEALDFVRGSYEGRRKYDLLEDATFGTRCLDTDEKGRCTAWSLSKDLVTSAYPDCTKVLIPQYETSQLATCTGTSTAQLTPECRQRNYLSTTVQSVAGPCTVLQMDARPDQIYAVCRDNLELCRVNKGTVQNPFGVDYADVRAEMCAVIGGCGYCREICSSEYDTCMASDTCSPEYDGCLVACEGNQNCLDDCSYLYCAPCGSNQECAGTCRSRYCSQQCDYTTVSCSSHCDGITMNGYRVCALPGAPSGMSLNTALLLTTPQSYGFTTAGDYGHTVTWQSLFGGPGAEKNINKWYTKLIFSCGVEQNDCAALEEQGCVPYARRCTDDACTRSTSTPTGVGKIG